MIKGFTVPLNEWKIHSIVIRVTTGTILAGAGAHVISGVKSAVRVEPGGNLGMALQAFENGLPASQLVTGAALGCAVQ